MIVAVPSARRGHSYRRLFDANSQQACVFWQARFRLLRFGEYRARCRRSRRSCPSEWCNGCSQCPVTQRYVSVALRCDTRSNTAHDGSDGGLDSCNGCVSVLRWISGRPVQPTSSIQGFPSEFKPRSVQEGERFPIRRCSDHQGGVVGHCPEFLFALPQSFIHAFAFGDITIDPRIS